MVCHSNFFVDGIIIKLFIVNSMLQIPLLICIVHYIKNFYCILNSFCVKNSTDYWNSDIWLNLLDGLEKLVLSYSKPYESWEYRIICTSWNDLRQITKNCFKEWFPTPIIKLIKLQKHNQWSPNEQTSLLTLTVLFEL